MTQLQNQTSETAQNDAEWDHNAPVQTRSERFKSTDVNEFPDVTGREVNWKHTPVARLKHFIEGKLVGGEYPVEVSDTPGVTASWISMDDDLVGRAGIPEDKAVANAWGQAQLAQHILFESQEYVTLTVKRNELTSDARATHTVLEIAPQAQGLILLENSGKANLIETVEFLVGEGANVTVASIQEWDDDAIHVADHHASIGKDATLQHIVVSLGGEIVRINPSLHLNEQGANGESYGAYFADAHQHLEHQVYMDHNAPYTRSRVAYKGALQGEGARAVWIGDVLIRRVATGTDSYEENRNLTLTEGTHTDSIPNLEIETGDIAGAGHASTTGRFDEEHIFYLQSRGISANEARKLVVRGFLIDVIQRIGNDAVEERLQQAIDQELEASVLVP